jgi:hypothetical protein
MRKLWLLLFCGLLALPFDSEAQFNRKQIKKNNKRIASYRGRKQHFGKEKIYNAIGFSINATNYYGDLAPKPNRLSTDISFTRPGFGVSFGHRFGPRYTLLGQFMVTTLRGSDNKSADPNNSEYNGRYLRNLEFRNTIKEFSAVAVFDLFENMATYISRVKWTPYAFVGVAGFISTPKGRAPETDLQGNPLPQAGEWVKLRPLGTEGQYADLLETDANYGIKPYKAFQFAIPFGIGARYRINQVLDVWADIGFRYTFTDYLDDVSNHYVDLGVFGNNELAKAMSYRTNELNPGGLQPELARDGITYQLRPGYGKEHPTNIRGSDNDKDIYMVTSIRLTYILGATYHKARFR